MNLIGKRILVTTVDDTRFIKGENLLDSFKSDVAFGGSMTWYFDDNTYLFIQPVQTREGEWIMGCKEGKWESGADNQIRKIESS